MGHAASMHAHSPGSYSISLMIHGAVVLAVLLSTYYLSDVRKKPSSQIIELVAGPGDDYMARQAPALGTPETINPVPDLNLSPLEPVVEPPPQPVVTPAPNTPVIPPPKKTVAPKTTPKTETPPKRISKAEFDKLNASKNKNLPSQKINKTKSQKKVVAPKIGQGVAKGVLGGIGSGAGAGGTALTAAERGQMEAYFALLAQRIRQAQEKPEGLSSELVVRIEFQVYSNGTIGAVKIVRSSGNRAFDDSVLKAIRTVRPIGPRPDGKSGAKVADFRMREED
ncbi:energy transducer TonB [Ereboglobus luteus]|uniref:TonB C-terminal domain-containing protein n=1 Tax=Ereboglobus luteus TaxID=1796921 RepID=A0A2U8E2J1_9BACT|nr:TonB family protein [Ereboglobus luteus]AWI09051.1 hypothetical protein CKA38_07180 [Ereboglobus luteus]